MTTEKELFIQQIANFAQEALIKGYKAEASVLFSLCGAASLDAQDKLCLHVAKFTEASSVELKSERLRVTKTTETTYVLRGLTKDDLIQLMYAANTRIKLSNYLKTVQDYFAE